MTLEYINKCEIPEESDLEENVFDLSRKIVHFVLEMALLKICMLVNMVMMNT